jgi:hypothetical protein
MSESRIGSPRFSETCKRCGGAFQYVAALPKSIGDDGYDVYQCADCKGIEWVSRQSESR